MKKTLRVRSSERAMVANLEATFKDGQVRRFIGRKFDPSIGPAGGWQLKDEPEEIPYRAEYMQALRDGDLIPADEETAKLLS